MQRGSHIAILLISGIFMFSCAKQNSSGPSGGPRDETPPAVVKSVPPDKTVNFTEKEFEITFDEFFVLDNVNQKLMISPPFDKRPEVQTKGKTMKVSFEEELRDSITYTFYFMDAVKDLNEGNPIENFQYVFSTGPTLDSLSVTGHIFDAFSLNPGEEIFISLYSNLSDTAPETILPEYITRAGTDGKFRIDNIAEGEYAIYGLLDLNNNKIYDLDDESFAFIDSTITLSGANNFIPARPDSLKTAADSALYLSIPGEEYVLYSFQAESQQQYLTTTSREEAYKLMYVFKQPVDSGQFSVSFIDSLDIRYSLELSPNRDTVLIWILDSLAYQSQRLSVRTDYPETDTTGAISIVTDTISFRYLAPRPQRGRQVEEKESLSVRHNLSARAGFKPDQDIVFSFDTPLKEPDTSLLRLFLIADTNRIVQTYDLSRDPVSNKKYILKHEFIQDSTYLLLYDKGTFSDIYGNLNDSTGIRFRINNSESYGTLTLRLSGYQGNIILQLLDSDERLVRENYVEMTETQEIYYPLLDMGEYMVKAIFDLNKDGEWTTGNYKDNLQPEPVSFYPSIIEIKVEWDLVQDWELKDFNYKNDLMRKEKKTVAR